MPRTKLIRGVDLTEDQRKEALERFYPTWPYTDVKGLFPTEWLRVHAFYVTADGALSRRHRKTERVP